MAQTRLNTSEEHCKISKDAKFERDLLKNNKYIALQKHCILRLYNVWWGQVLCPHHTNVCKIFALQLYGAISPLAFNVSLLNLASLQILRSSFEQYQWIFAIWSLSKLEKYRGRVCCYRKAINCRPKSLWQIFLFSLQFVIAL